MNVLKELVSKCSSKYQEYFSIKEIEEILSVDGGIEENVTISSGTHLELCHLRLIGTKSETAQDEFRYERKFYPGINTLISSGNSKGKSTIFKCIKFALTGRESLKKDMSEWIKHIIFEFKIGEKTYISHIDNSGNRVKGHFYRTNLEKYDAKNIRDIDLIFQASSKDELEERCKEFFYKQLGINSLKWTQKDSRKEVHQLNEAGTSWVTFFKTIYLESKDTNTLIYGAQATLLVQILLGLGLTTSMNRLKVKKEKLQFKNAIPSNYTKDSSANSRNLISELEMDLESAKSELLTLQKSDNANNISNMINEKSSLVLKFQTLEDKKLLNIEKSFDIHKKISNLNYQINKLGIDYVSLEKEKLKIQKQILRIEEHIEIGSFFSNLEIKSCPSCNTNLEKSVSVFNNSHECKLCHHEVKNDDRKEDVTRLESKIVDMSQEIDKIETQLTVIQKEKDKAGIKLQKLKGNENTIDLSTDDNELKHIRHLIKALEEKIETERTNQVSKNNRSKEIEDKIAILKYRLSEANKPSPKDTIEEERNRNIQKINLLEDSILCLQEIRANTNKSIINEFKKIILSTLHSLGLDSFTDIEIDSGLHINYIQRGKKLSYSDITEGEQLRVKVAFYLSLVQLNSEYGVGNHPRLLIIDSPGKEEADDNYFDGFIDALNTIEDKFSDKIQVLIGSADRRLTNLSNSISKEKQEIKDKGETFF